MVQSKNLLYLCSNIVISCYTTLKAQGLRSHLRVPSEDSPKGTTFGSHRRVSPQSFTVGSNLRVPTEVHPRFPLQDNSSVSYIRVPAQGHGCRVSPQGARFYFFIKSYCFCSQKKVVLNDQAQSCFHAFQSRCS